jgi:hypothetical protein
MKDPFARKIKDLSSLREATKILNALNGNDSYDGNPDKLAKYKAEDIRKINGLGLESVSVIAKALESIGIIGDANEWLG